MTLHSCIKMAHQPPAHPIVSLKSAHSFCCHTERDVAQPAHFPAQGHRSSLNAVLASPGWKHCPQAPFARSETLKVNYEVAKPVLAIAELQSDGAVPLLVDAVIEINIDVGLTCSLAIDKLEGRETTAAVWEKLAEARRGPLLLV